MTKFWTQHLAEHGGTKNHCHNCIHLLNLRKKNREKKTLHCKDAQMHTTWQLYKQHVATLCVFSVCSGTTSKCEAKSVQTILILGILYAHT